MLVLDQELSLQSRDMLVHLSVSQDRFICDMHKVFSFLIVSNRKFLS